ncbi:hypothetical protein DPEC_G00097620 [Dallia pectoralis]|uniref:Uncharacterized protein n=1 Tax=Dallia pectoralis TaxID=75939 RepID=A0ACC2GW92_DALPE|nr:hypothetical protein DPEC_G00097620 [Dallia pectoralis]
MGDDEEAVASSSTTQYLTQEDNEDGPVSTASDDTMNQPIPGPSSSPGEPVEEHLEDPTSPTLDQKPTKEQVELLLLALKLKHGLTNRALEDIMHLMNFNAGPGGELRPCLPPNGTVAALLDEAVDQGTRHQGEQRGIQL